MAVFADGRRSLTVPGRWLLMVLGALATMHMAATPAAAGGVLRIGGTGMGLAAMQVLGDGFANASPNLKVEVLTSLGTTGGINALLEGAIDIAIAARQPKKQEMSKGITAGFCGRTALAFATSHRNPGNLERRDLPAIFADPAPRWPDGSPLKIILRSPTGSEHPYLAERIPGMAEALQAAARRGDVPVGATDQENVELARQTAGSLAIATLMQVRAERLPLRLLALDGVEPSATSLADGSYGLPIEACLLLPAKPSAEANQFMAYLRTPAARATLRDLGTVATD